MASKVPIFQEVADTLSAQIRGTELTPGAALPSENELCRQYNTSRFSIRKALDILEGDGLIFRQPGVGSFVRERMSGGTVHKTLDIAITAVDPDNWYASEVYKGAREACSECDARLVLTSLDDFVNRGGAGFDGFILLSMSEPRSQWEKLNVIAGDGVPVVLLNRFTDLGHLAYLSVNYETESQRAVEFLLRMGRKRVAAVGFSTITPYASGTRLNGYRAACRANGCEELVASIEANGINAVAEVEAFLEQNHPDSLFVTSQNLLDYTLLACRSRKLEVGRDIAVFCWVDRISSSNQNAMYIEMPLAEMASKAVHYIARKRRDRNAVPVLREVLSSNFVFNSNIL